MPSQNQLTLDQVTLAYDADPIVRDASLQVPAGETLCLFGPSGCGKSSLLRCIGGFLPPQTGKVILGERVLEGDGKSVAPEQRRMGWMQQDLALFPHLTVTGNVAFGLHDLPKSQRAKKVQEWLQKVGLQQFGSAYPHELSGGQRQRVALARALAPGPQLLLLDEPFSALDASNKAQLIEEVSRIIKSEAVTTILVTHDVNEAFAMGQQIAVLSAGRILQTGTPAEILHQPKTVDVADIISSGLWLDAVRGNAGRFQTALGSFRSTKYADAERLQVLVRSNDLHIGNHGGVEATVISCNVNLDGVTLELQTPAGIVRSRHERSLTLQEGDRINVSLKEKSLICFPMAVS